MNCNDLHACALTPILRDLRNNRDEDHAAAQQAEWFATMEAFTANGDDLGHDDHDLHCCINRGQFA